MRVTVNRELLLQALKACGPVIPSRTPKAVLQCMHASVKDKQLCLRATDMEMTVEATLTQVDPVQDGQILIPFERLAGVANSAGTDTMILSGEDVGDVVQVKAGQGTFRIFSQPASDFPPSELPPMEGTVSIPGQVLRQMIDRTAYAAATEVTRFAINGLLVEIGGGAMKVVATDGHRLACAKTAVDTDKNTKLRIIVPIRLIKLVRRAMGEDDRVELLVGRNRVTFFLVAEGETGPRLAMSSVLLEGKFPPYEDVIPKDALNKFTFRRADMMRAIDMAEVFTSPESKGLKFQFFETSAQISSRAPEIGESSISVPAARNAGDNSLIGFQPHYVAEFLKSVETEEVAIELTTPHKAGLFRAGPDYLYVVMPVSLDK